MLTLTFVEPKSIHSEKNPIRNIPVRLSYAGHVSLNKWLSSAVVYVQHSSKDAEQD